MAYRTLDHSDKTLFKNRLYCLMEEHGIFTAKELAKELYEKGYVSVNQKKESFSDPCVIDNNAVASIEKKIQKHLNADKPDKLQGEFVMAYCRFFGCSADYLFGYIALPTHKTTNIYEETGLSENAIDRLVQLNVLSKLFPGSQRDKFKVINLILSDTKDNNELSSLLEYLVAFCRFKVSPDNDHSYVVNKNGIHNFHPKKSLSNNGYLYNPLESHFNLKDMESMYYLKIWDSIKNLKQQYQKTPDPN